MPTLVFCTGALIMASLKPSKEFCYALLGNISSREIGEEGADEAKLVNEHFVKQCQAQKLLDMCGGGGSTLHSLHLQ